MSKKNKHKSLIYVITAAIALSIGCSPAPMIQSAHVQSVVKAGVNATATNYDNDFVPYYLAFGIKDRVELSGSFIPFIRAAADMKIFIVEYGNSGLFRNVSTAVFSGGKATNWDREYCKSAHAGIIVSTIHKGKVGDAELVFQPSFFRLIDDYTSSGGDENYRLDGLHLNCGTILTIDPKRDNRFSSGCRLGVGYQYALDLRDYLPHVNRAKSIYNDWFFEFGLDFNWKSKRQMRKS